MSGFKTKSVILKHSIYKWFINLYCFSLVYLKTKRNKKIKILFICLNYNIGGAEKVLIDIGNALDKTTFHSAIIATDTGNQSWKKRFKNNFNVVFDYGKNKNASDLTLFTGVFYKPDYVFISHSIKAYYLIHKIKERIPGVKIYDILHTYESGYPELSLPFIENLDKRVVISEKLKSELSALYNKHGLANYADRLQVIYNGIDNLPLKPIDQYKFRPDNCSLFIGLVGRLSEEKDPMKLLEIADNIHIRNKSIWFCVAGDGPLLQRMQFECTRKGLDDKIQFTGFLKSPDELISELDILLITSRREGIPMSAMEAMQKSKCVISTEVGAINELIDHELEGFLIDKENMVEKMVELIVKLYDSPGKINTISAKALEKVKKKFSKSIMAAKYNQLFNA